eukprot:14078855-Alexandrium_andersonii.AAC.1
MSASLVGSEMCIRDSLRTARARGAVRVPGSRAGTPEWPDSPPAGLGPSRVATPRERACPSWPC